MDEHNRCPGCQSHNLRGGKSGFEDGSVYDFYCLDCGLGEWKSTRDADFDSWRARWSAPAKPAGPAASKAARGGRRSGRSAASAPGVGTPVSAAKAPEPVVRSEPYFSAEEGKDVLHWPQKQANRELWRYLAEVPPAELQHGRVEVRVGKTPIATVVYDAERRAVEEIAVSQYYFPSDRDFRDWAELFRFERLRKLRFDFYCQWISVPDLPAGAWPVLEQLHIELYARDGYHNLIGQEDVELQRRLPHVKVTSNVDSYPGDMRWA